MQTVCINGLEEIDLQNIQDQLNAEFAKYETRVFMCGLATKWLKNLKN